jgi:hypothetical protein
MKKKSARRRHRWDDNIKKNNINEIMSNCFAWLSLGTKIRNHKEERLYYIILYYIILYFFPQQSDHHNNCFKKYLFYQKNTLEPGYNKIVLRETSSIT